MKSTEHAALIAHIKKLNVATLAWVAEEPDKRFASTFPEDLKYWADQGINSIEDFEHDDLVTTVYETTKSVWGYKPNWSDLKAMSNDALKAEAASLQAAWEAGAAQRAADAAHDLVLEEEYMREQLLMAEAASVDAAEYFGWDHA